MNRAFLGLSGFVVILVACSSDPAATTPGTSSACPSTSNTTSIPGTGANAALVEETAFAPVTENLKMWIHAPANVGKDPAIVVAMHGCTQDASAYAAAGWNELADKTGFVVVYPEQSSANSGTLCFRWWEPAHTTRDKGEAKAIAAMVARAREKYGSGGKTYVTGLSAGGAMTAVMLAAYPDLFDAGAIMSGIPYDCATSQLDAFSCMNPGKTKSADEWKALVPAVAGSKPPRVSIWHGDADFTVNDSNEASLVLQWTAVNGASATPSKTETVGKAKHESFADASGAVRVESWLVAGMGHGTPVDPANGCGTAGAYILDVGICSTERAAQFFGIVGSTAPASTSSSSSSSSSSGAVAANPCR